MKKCIKCSVEKELSEFYKSNNRKTPDGYRGVCKSCTSKQAKERSKRPKIYVQTKACIDCGDIKDRSMFNNNIGSPDGLHTYCKTCHGIRAAKYASDNKDHVLSQKREYHRLKKDDEHYINVRKAYSDKYIKQPQIRILRNLRRELWGFIKNDQEAKIIRPLIGIDRDGFKKHIESKFYGDMSWDTYGETWQIDHKKPCSSFNLLDKDEVERCFHYTNMQPLTEFDNVSKGCRIIT